MKYYTEVSQIKAKITMHKTCTYGIFIYKSKYNLRFNAENKKSSLQYFKMASAFGVVWSEGTVGARVTWMLIATYFFNYHMNYSYI